MKPSERRHSPRVIVTGLARLAPSGDPSTGNTSLVELRNLSAQGVQVEITDDDMRMLGEARNDDGTWPVSDLQLIPDDSLAQGNSDDPSCWIQVQLIFSRRLSQHRYLAGFRFLETPAPARETILTLISEGGKTGETGLVDAPRE